MATPFVKMHGLGNDFVVFDARALPGGTLPELTPPLVRALADRHRGIGCDQLVLVEPPRDPGLAAFVRLWNRDGSEISACGNAMRCVARLIGESASIATAAGIVRLSPVEAGAAVDMGEPAFEWDRIPLAFPLDTAAMPVAWESLERPAAVSMGNPHAVFFVDDALAVDLARLGPVIESDPLFPEGVNVGAASVDAADHISLRVWERGSGLTQACGTGACAAAVAAMRRGLVRSPVSVEQAGGTLVVEWQPGGTVRMTGPAATSFRGQVDLEAFA